MKTVASLASAIICLVLLLSSSLARAQDIRVRITGIRSNKGNIILNVFKDQESYAKENPYKTIVLNKDNIDHGRLEGNFRIDPGTYGITLIDDENHNGKIDRNIIGLPREGFGFSNYIMEKMSRPKFTDFEVDLHIKQDFSIQLKYL